MLTRKGDKIHVEYNQIPSLILLRHCIVTYIHSNIDNEPEEQDNIVKEMKNRKTKKERETSSDKTTEGHEFARHVFV